MHRLRLTVTTIIVAILATFAFMVSGCGGSGANVATTTRLVATPVSTTLELPSSSSVDASSLTVWTSAGSTTPEPGGKVTPTIFNNGPQYADAKDSSGRLVMASYLSSKNRVMNATTTAQSLIFVALGGLMQIDRGPITILEGVPELPGFSEVVDEVSRQISEQGFVSLSTGTLRAQIQSIVDAVLAQRGRGTIAEPTSSSGLFLDTSEDGFFKIQNNHLRRSIGLLRRISYVDANGDEHSTEGPTTKIDIPSPSRYGGLTSTIAGVVLGDYVWTPTVTSSIPIELWPGDALSTTYELVTLGLGASAGIETSLNADQQEELDSIMLKGFVLDVLIPPLTNIIMPLNGDRIDHFLKYSNGSTLLTDFIGQLSGTAPNLVSLLKEGKLTEATQLLYNSALTTNSAVPFVIHLMQEYAEEYGDDAILSGLGDQSEAISDKLAKLGFVDVFFSAADMALLSYDFSNSNRADRTLITTTGGGKVTVFASRSLTCVSEPLPIQCVIQNKPSDAVFVYEWSVSSGYRIDAENGSTATSSNGVLISSHDSVTLRPLDDQTGTATVTCKVKRKNGVKEILIDEDQRDFKIIPDPEITPTSPRVDSGESITLRASYSGEGTPLWKFVLNTPAYGSINRTSIGNNPEVVFTSNGQYGIAIIAVEMYLTIDNKQVKVCNFLKSITIGTDTFPVSWFVTYEPWHTDQVLVNVYGYVSIPRENDPNIKLYALINPNTDTAFAQWTNTVDPPSQGTGNLFLGQGNSYWYVRVGGGNTVKNSQGEAEAYFDLVKQIQGQPLINNPPRLVRVPFP